jgi:hypothetical protein
LSESLLFPIKFPHTQNTSSIGAAARHELLLPLVPTSCEEKAL